MTWLLWWTDFRHKFIVKLKLWWIWLLQWRKLIIIEVDIPSSVGIEHWLCAHQKIGAQLRNPASSWRPLQMDNLGLCVHRSLKASFRFHTTGLLVTIFVLKIDLHCTLPWTKSQMKNLTVIHLELHSLLSFVEVLLHVHSHHSPFSRSFYQI